MLFTFPFLIRLTSTRKHSNGTGDQYRGTSTNVTMFYMHDTFHIDYNWTAPLLNVVSYSHILVV